MTADEIIDLVKRMPGAVAVTALLGYAPAAHSTHHADVDYAASDRLLPHPTYATQGWVCVVAPGQGTAAPLTVRLVGVTAGRRPLSRW